MRIEFDSDISAYVSHVQAGNVYTVRGGKGARYGHLMIIISIRPPLDRFDCDRATVLTINKEGDIIGATVYNLSYFEDKTPIAFAEGLEDVTLRIRNL